MEPARGAERTVDEDVARRGAVGELDVLAGPGEYNELTHRATSRDVFVHGALSAARWLHGRAPGDYTIEDVLGLSRR